MRVIIDECVPYIVKRRLPERQIKTVREMGWAGVKNGDLLKLVDENFEIFITSDKNLKPAKSSRPKSGDYPSAKQSGSHYRKFVIANRHCTGKYSAG
jgi:hypothetical protein